MPLVAAKLLSVPPVTVMSSTMKSVDVSLSVKVRVATSPTLRALSLVAIVTVGATVSTATVSAVKVLPALPAASVQLAVVKLMVSAAVSSGGVSVAV